MIPSKLRRLTAAGLSTSARALSLSSHLLEGLSGLLRPDERSSQDQDTATAGPPTEEGPGPVPTAGAPAGRNGVVVDEVPEDGWAGDYEAVGETWAAGEAGVVGEATAEVDLTPTEPVPGVEEHARTYDTHVEELADKPAAAVISAVEHLSTDELERLYSHEQRNKKRKTVLAAIERSLAPPDGR